MVKKTILVIVLVLEVFCLGRFFRKEELTNLENIVAVTALEFHRLDMKFRNLKKSAEIANLLHDRLAPKLMDVTAYVEHVDCGIWCDDPYTASMAIPKEGRTLACPPEYEFGTQFYVSGVGLLVCEDRGGAIKGRKLDVFMRSLRKAKNFGLKKNTPTLVISRTSGRYSEG